MNNRTEDNRGDHHFDEFNETIPQRFEGFSKFWKEGSHQNAGRHRQQNLHIKNAVPRNLGGLGNRHHRHLR